jgi:hypothetical protein
MSLKDIVANTVVPIGNGIIMLLYSAAFLFFIFGVFKYFFLKTADPKSREEGRMAMIWGIVGLAVLFSVWSIVRLATGVFTLPGA